MTPQNGGSEILEHVRSLETQPVSATPFQVCRRLAEYTRAEMDKENVPAVKSVLARLLSAYRNTTSPTVRAAIENVYIYSIGRHLRLAREHRHLAAFFPQIFRRVLFRQLGAGL